MKVKVKVSYVRLFVTPWAIQSMEYSRPEYWSGQPFPAPGDLPTQAGIEPRSPVLQADSLLAEPQGKARHLNITSVTLMSAVILSGKNI